MTYFFALPNILLYTGYNCMKHVPNILERCPYCMFILSGVIDIRIYTCPEARVESTPNWALTNSLQLCQTR